MDLDDPIELFKIWMSEAEKTKLMIQTPYHWLLQVKTTNQALEWYF